MNETRLLADYIAGLRYDDLPPEVVDVAKDRILDQFGAQLIGSVQDWSKVILRYTMDVGGKPESTVVYYGDRTDVLNTAFVNSCFGHGFEIDDTYRNGGGHLGCTIVPPAEALGERERCSGKELITAVVAGYEAGGRVGRAAGMAVVNRGFDRTTTWGPLSAAAVGGILLGFDGVKMRHAFSIAAGEAGGLQQFIRSGDVVVKRLYGGKAAYGGLRAAFLAGSGMSGPADAFEGESGALHAFSDDPHPDEIVRDFGLDWVILDTAYKHHCCGSLMQGQADAAITLRQKHQFELEEIEEIVVGTLERGTYMGGAITEPTSAGEAQFSTAFIVALALNLGHCGHSAFADGNLRDPAVRAVARKVKVMPEPELEKLGVFGKQPARVTILLKDGRAFEEFLEDYIGTPSNPMSRTQVQEKFRELASAVLAKDKVERLIAHTERLDAVADVSALAALLVR